MTKKFFPTPSLLAPNPATFASSALNTLGYNTSKCQQNKFHKNNKLSFYYSNNNMNNNKCCCSNNTSNILNNKWFFSSSSKCNSSKCNSTINFLHKLSNYFNRIILNSVKMFQRQARALLRPRQDGRSG